MENKHNLRLGNLNKKFVNKRINFSPIISTITDIELFIDKLEKRKNDLEELKDEILIYNDEKFIKSMDKGLKDLGDGKFKRCQNLGEVKKLFDEL